MSSPYDSWKKINIEAILVAAMKLVGNMCITSVELVKSYLFYMELVENL